MNATRRLAWGRSLALAAMVLTLASCAGTESLRQRDWMEYQNRFIAGDGRVTDTANDNDSHSEGQGFGMLLAEGYGDRPTFDRIWDWTKTHLQVRREDRLLAWHWLRRRGRVGDMNNAPDGDILVAWALLRAARRWSEPEYERQAREILDAVQARLLVGAAVTCSLAPTVSAMRAVGSTCPTGCFRPWPSSSVHIRIRRFGARCTETGSGWFARPVSAAGACRRTGSA